MRIQKCSAPSPGAAWRELPKKRQKVIPVDSGPKSFFSSKDAANWRKSVDSFFVGKTSYYMVTPATSFFDADSNLEKLVGGGRVSKRREKKEEKLFLLPWALPWAMKLLPAYFLRTTCARNLAMCGALLAMCGALLEMVPSTFDDTRSTFDNMRITFHDVGSTFDDARSTFL